MIIRKALESEHKILTDITVRSKMYWNYKQEYYELWKDDLTVTSDYIKKNTVYVAEESSALTGYISITEENIKDNKSGFWKRIKDNEDEKHKETDKEKIVFIDNLFIEPKYIKQGIGKKLLTFTLNILISKKVKTVYLVSDPNAKNFYEKMGFDFVCNKPSSIQYRDLFVYKKYLI